MTKRIDTCEEIVAIINKFKLNKRLLATSIGIGQAEFSHKFNSDTNRNGYLHKFTPSQKEKLTAVIKNIGVELSALEK